MLLKYKKETILLKLTQGLKNNLFILVFLLCLLAFTARLWRKTYLACTTHL